MLIAGPLFALAIIFVSRGSAHRTLGFMVKVKSAREMLTAVRETGNHLKVIGFANREAELSSATLLLHSFSFSVGFRLLSSLGNRTEDARNVTIAIASSGNGFRV